MEKTDSKIIGDSKADDLAQMDSQGLSLPVSAALFTSFESDITENEDEDRPLIRAGGSTGTTASGLPSFVGQYTNTDTARKVLEYTKHIQGLSADMTSSVESSRDLLSSDNEGTDQEPFRKNIAYMRLAETGFVGEEGETEDSSLSATTKKPSSTAEASASVSQKNTEHPSQKHSKSAKTDHRSADSYDDTVPSKSGSGSRTSNSGSRSSSSDSPDRTLVEDPADDGDDDDDSPRSSSSRPNDLTLPKPLQHYERIQRMKYTSETEDAVDVLDELAKTPLQSQGTVMKEGELVAFVADDLQQKIKLSSPCSKDGDLGGVRERKDSQASSLKTTSSSNYSLSSNSSVTSSSTWSTAATPIHRRRSNADVPPIDPHVLRDIEIQATHISDNLDQMLKKLKTSMERMSAITVGCVDTYKEAIDNTCDAVDGSIKSMYALMAKCEELSKSVKPIYDIHEQIKEIKRLLDMFEMQIATQDH
ncbi:BLOC-1-related complex subunit 6 [Lingula anatina]|uniref:BLOC-1-related complex subunit 6 n=1 Tax=Lingula anatina TaxID=7574 RepID=A0A1S3K3I0_LINAN|nr:BLOC-1-related complex subunit 6 [Lingula anatina]|eukprot:XP_013416974.1 BLOC-1-related complex subunit 6 [Lingula anatina]